MQVLSFVCTVGFSFTLVDAYGNYTRSEDEHRQFYFFPNLTAIKDFFKNDSSPYSHQILETFEKDCLYMPDPGIPVGRRKPFIVIEGNHRPSRNVLGMKLARRLNGRYLNNLAPCLHDLFQKLPQGSLTRRVFYLLSVYATVFNAKVHLNLNRAVVLNGYWWEQVTFSMLQALRGAPFPSIEGYIFQQPPDLLQPDLIVYVDNLERTSLQNLRSMQLYQKLANRYPITIQTIKGNLREAIEDVYANIRNNLTDYRDFRYKADPYYA